MTQPNTTEAKKDTVAAFMSYLKTNREEIQDYNEKLISSGEYIYDEDVMGAMGSYPLEETIPPQPGVVELGDIIENSEHQLHHDERQVKDAHGKPIKQDLEDKFLAWHREHLFKTLASIAKDNDFTVTPEQLSDELTPEINAILALNPKADSLTVLNTLLDEYPTDTK